MTQHTHTSITKGCYRCELNGDEAKSATEELEAEVERLRAKVGDLSMSLQVETAKRRAAEAERDRLVETVAREKALAELAPRGGYTPADFTPAALSGEGS